jgi:hypothetical protein
MRLWYRFYFSSGQQLLLNLNDLSALYNVTELGNGLVCRRLGTEQQLAKFSKC